MFGSMLTQAFILIQVFLSNCAPILDSKDTKGSLAAISKKENNNAIQKIIKQTIVSEESSNHGLGVVIGEALKAFEKKLKDMDPIEITNAKTVKDKKEEALAEQKAQEANDDIKIVEGDIIETKGLEAIINNSTTKRDIQVGEKWGLIIPYQLPIKITGDIGLFERSINEAIRELSSESCLKFVKRLNDGRSNSNKNLDGSSESYIMFIQGAGCYSRVGKRNGLTDHDISIGKGCEHKGTVVHEILHTLGFFHEQSRLDRDKFVRVNPENIIRGMEHNFNKYNHGIADTLGYVYDYDSIMHYGKDWFSKNRKNTIDVIGPARSIGERSSLSVIDGLQLNHAYCSNEYKNIYNNLRSKNMETISKNLYASV